MNVFSKLLCRMLPVSWTQPTLTGNGTFGGSQMAVSWTAGGNSGTQGTPYQAFRPNGGQLYVYADEYKTWVKIFIYTPIPVRARAISFYINSWVPSSGAAYNVKFYGGYAKDDNRELLKNIGNVGEGASYYGNITTNSEYQYYTLYMENGGGAYEDSVTIKDILFQAEYDDFV